MIILLLIENNFYLKAPALLGSGAFLFIFVAIKEKTDLKVVEIEIKEDGSFLELGNVFTAKEVPPGFALELIALRPEGAPYYKLLVSTNDSEEVTYYVSYNGKDGNPKIEYIYNKKMNYNKK